MKAQKKHSTKKQLNEAGKKHGKNSLKTIETTLKKNPVQSLKKDFVPANELTQKENLNGKINWKKSFDKSAEKESEFISIEPEAQEIEKRKLEHLKICLTKNIQFRQKTAGFEDVELMYDALPELSEEKINLETVFLGKKFKAPLIINGMTGGCKLGKEINEKIAEACEEWGIGMGVGSQRAMLQNQALKETFDVKKKYPNIFLAGNIGFAQLNEFGFSLLGWALNEIQADALAIHVNAAQELIQKEGNKNFEQCVQKIKEISLQANKPIYVKEVGQGISMETALKLEKTKIEAIDVSGAGGTNWISIENNRKFHTGAFEEFGLPTIVSLLEVKKVSSKKIIASGGIRNGLDAVKALVLGADLVGIALPVLKAWQSDKENGIKNYLEQFIHEMKIGCMLVGAKNLNELKHKKFVLRGKTFEWAMQRKLI